MSQHFSLPEPVSGYQLDAEASFWSICVAEATENLILDPSWEHQTDINNIDEDALYGTVAWRSMSATQNFTSRTAGAYTFSFYTRRFWEGGLLGFGTIGCRFYVAKASTPNDPFRSEYFTIGNEWERHIYTFPCEADTEYELLLEVQDFANLSTDGWQVENKPYATTYVDGDLGIYYPDDRTCFYWTGEPHNSTSIRTIKTRMGGRFMPFSDFDFRTTTIQGFGRAPVANSFQTALSGKHIPEAMFYEQRELIIGGTIIGCSHNGLMQRRRRLVQAFSPYHYGEWKPLLLRCRLTDEDIDYDLICYYNDGLQGEVDNLYQQKWAISVLTSEPNWLGRLRSSSVTMMGDPAPYKVLERNMETGVYTGWDHAGSGQTYAIDYDSASSVYVAGTHSGGVHKLRPVGSGVATQVGNSSFTGTTTSMAVSKAGDLAIVIGGNFSSGGTDTSINAYITPTGWLDGDMGVYLQYPWFNELNNAVFTDVVDCVLWHDGYFYVGGSFSRVIGSWGQLGEHIDLVARYDPNQNFWTPLGVLGLNRPNNSYSEPPVGGPDSCKVTTITYGNDGYLYLTGQWSTTSHANALVSSETACRYNIAANRFEDVLPLHEQPNNVTNQYGYDAAMSPAGTFYGLFFYPNITTLEHPSGAAWLAQNIVPAGSVTNRLDIDFASDGTLLIAGCIDTGTAAPQTVLYTVAPYGNTPSVSPIDMFVPNGGNVVNKARTALKVVGTSAFVGMDGLEVQTGIGSTIVNEGDEVARFGVLAGHGTTTYGIINETTGKRIIFNSAIAVPYGTTYVIQEIGGTLFYRNLGQPNDRYTIIPIDPAQSDITTLDLLPGENTIKVLYGSTENFSWPETPIARGYTMFWQDRVSGI